MNKTLFKDNSCTHFILFLPWKHTKTKKIENSENRSIFKLRSIIRLTRIIQQTTCLRRIIRLWCENGHFYLLQKRTLLNIYLSSIYVDDKEVGDVIVTKMEPWYNEGPRDWQNLFAITRFRFVDRRSFSYFIITGAKKIVHFTEDLVV